MENDFKMEESIIRCWSVYVPDEAGEEVTKTLKSKWINTGKKEKEFREKVQARFMAPYVAACMSGTAALKIALKALGVGPGDEVVSTPFTFIATNTSILEIGAKPVFADIQYGTLNIDPKSVEEKITNKTKAIMCVHYAGNPVDMTNYGKWQNAMTFQLLKTVLMPWQANIRGNQSAPSVTSQHSHSSALKL